EDQLVADQEHEVEPGEREDPPRRIAGVDEDPDLRGLDKHPDATHPTGGRLRIAHTELIALGSPHGIGRGHGTPLCQPRASPTGLVLHRATLARMVCCGSRPYGGGARRWAAL